MKQLFYYDFTLVGRLHICDEEGFITDIGFGDYDGTAALNESPLIARAFVQLSEYFEGKRATFDLPLKPKGTPFQLAVWRALERIPYGMTVSYQDIAVAIGNPRAVRAVGQANNRNKICIVLPCHRVIGKNGALVGYGGGLQKKVALLELEKQFTQG